jgi:disulfide bond formation protein DsbB
MTSQEHRVMIANPRIGNATGFAACTALMAYALYAQHGLGLEPCPLCVFQRVAVIALGFIFAIATLHGPGARGRKSYGLVMLGVALAGSGVAGRHVWLQSLPPDKVPTCGPGLDYMLETFPMRETVQMVLSGSGECANVDWSFLGLSMPAWVLIVLLALGAFALWNNWRAAA